MVNSGELSGDLSFLDFSSAQSRKNPGIKDFAVSKIGKHDVVYTI